MLTTCTACGTQFRVSTTQLRAVHGLVRCSRCHSVFDAFETLREEFEVADKNSIPPAVDLENSNGEPVAAENHEPPLISADIEAPVVDPDDPDIQLRQEPSVPPTDDLFADLWGESHEPSAATGPAGNASSRADKDAPVLIEDHIPRPPTLARDKALYKHVDLPPPERHAPDVSHKSMLVNRWGAGVVLMSFLLGIQIINANRQALSHSPLIGSPLSSLYSALGHPVRLPPSPAMWQVSNINVTSDPDTPGALSITGTLVNSANFAQPWPHLRIELTDRYGDALQARDFTAAMYLPANRANAWLNPGLAARFRIDVVDPGPEAVGFQVQPCVDLDSGRECSSGNTSD
jgi:predicted Zn finger-like uncharacterized protein